MQSQQKILEHSLKGLFLLFPPDAPGRTYIFSANSTIFSLGFDIGQTPEKVISATEPITGTINYVMLHLSNPFQENVLILSAFRKVVC